MSDRCFEVFISATGADLQSCRQLVKEALLALGCVPAEQTKFPSDYRTAHDMLRTKITACDAVVHLAGKCYGAEPSEREPTAPRRSYTQMEFDLARELKKPVYVLLCAEGFPYDKHPPEDAEKQQLQQAHRAILSTDEIPRYDVNSHEDIQLRVQELYAQLLGRGKSTTSTSTKPLVQLDSSDELPAAGDIREMRVVGSLKPQKPPQPIVDEDVQFSVYRPQIMDAASWHTWLAFGYRGTDSADGLYPAEEVERQARAILGDKFDEYKQLVQESSSALPRESTITVVPNVQGLEFNPPQRSFVWQEPVHREEFRVRSSPNCDGEILRGRITFFLGALVIAEINLSVKIGQANIWANPKMGMTVDRTRAYRRIFASYSRHDSGVVEHFEKMQAALGDRYLRDVTDLRSGEKWSERLEDMIRQADLFQLFWSSNSMQSQYVRKEWEYALNLGRLNFVRPTYWEDPFPEDFLLQLPPDELRKLHFQRIPDVHQQQRADEYAASDPPWSAQAQVQNPVQEAPTQASSGKKRKGMPVHVALSCALACCIGLFTLGQFGLGPFATYGVTEKGLAPPPREAARSQSEIMSSFDRGLTKPRDTAQQTKPAGTPLQEAAKPKEVQGSIAYRRPLGLAGQGLSEAQAQSETPRSQDTTKSQEHILRSVPEPFPFKNYATAMKDGQAAYEGSHYTEALSQTKVALDNKPADPDAAKLRNDAQARLDELAGRQQGYVAAVKAGMAAFEGKQYAEALRQADAALATQPGDAKATKLRARAQFALGNSLCAQAANSSGSQRTLLLSEAVTDYRRSLKSISRDALPQEWATAQSNLANALRDQADASTGPERTRLLAESVSAYEASLQVFTESAFPSQHNLAAEGLGKAEAELKKVQ